MYELVDGSTIAMTYNRKKKENCIASLFRKKDRMKRSNNGKKNNVPLAVLAVCLLLLPFDLFSWMWLWTLINARIKLKKKKPQE